MFKMSCNSVKNILLVFVSNCTTMRGVEHIKRGNKLFTVSV
jgi:hypothetical protein